MRRWQSLSLFAGIAALTWSSFAQAANAMVAPAAPPSPAGMVQVTFGLLVVVGLLFAVMWSLKKMGAGKHAPAGAVKVVGGVSVGNRERILVVEVADQWIVVGVTPTTISALSTMPRQVGLDLSPSAPLAKNFSVWLKQTIDKRNAGAAAAAAAADLPGSSHAP